MDRMYYCASKFNQTLDRWNIAQVKNLGKIFETSGIDHDNYCNLFSGQYATYWENYKDEPGVSYECE